MTQWVYVSDTNIWIDFRHAGLLEVLFDLPFKLCFDDAGVARLFELTSTHNNSSLADVSCYQLAKDTGRPLLTGDGQLRKQALKDRLTVHGALWLLDRLVEHGTVTPTQAAIGLESMLDRGARLPQEECRRRLHDWA